MSKMGFFFLLEILRFGFTNEKCDRYIYKLIDDNPEITIFMPTAHCSLAVTASRLSLLLIVHLVSSRGA